MIDSLLCVQKHAKHLYPWIRLIPTANLEGQVSAYFHKRDEMLSVNEFRALVQVHELINAIAKFQT